MNYLFCFILECTFLVKRNQFVYKALKNDVIGMALLYRFSLYKKIDPNELSYIVIKTELSTPAAFDNDFS